MRKSLKINAISKLPKKPGVYFLKNKDGDVFYIGKANNMRSRVTTHKRNEGNFRLDEKIDTVEWVETANEIDALLKEAAYIKRYGPRMNVQHRDDKKYSYVGVTSEELPRVFKTHQPQKTTKIEYIGPFTDGGALNTTLKYLRRIFPHYTANPKKPLRSKEHGALPCSWCHIELCPGANPDKREYRKNITAIKQVLSGRKQTVVRNLEKQMKQAARKKKYEKAAEVRDTKEALERVFEHHHIAVPWSPKKVQERTNAAQYLQKLIGADLPVRSVEGYDISNIQGKEPTASMVRFDEGRPNKSLYRKFNIQAPAQPDDYLMMKEVVRRRFKHKEWRYPDLILIDGGRGHLNAALAQLKKAGITIAAVSLAKREEELYLPGRKNPLRLENMPAEVENLLKHVRDEAHRFAVSHHRARHAKRFKK